jgi:hypothetical protein
MLVFTLSVNSHEDQRMVVTSIDISSLAMYERRVLGRSTSTASAGMVA